MGIYVFRLDSLHFKFQRGQIGDNDIVTFSVFVNQVERGRGAGFFTDVISGAFVPTSVVHPDIRRGMSRDWIIGPLEIASGDGITVVYSGVNTSDSPGGLNAQQQGQVETKILDSIVTAVVGAAGLGLVGTAIGAALGAIGDFIGALLGVTKQGPCNGLVFSDAIPFTGGGLEALPSTEHGIFSSTQGATFTRSHTDETTHDSSICGHIAETDVNFSIARLPFLSVRSMAFFVFGVRSNPELKDGLRTFGIPRASAPAITIDMFSDEIKGSLRTLLLAQSAANARGTLSTS